MNSTHQQIEKRYAILVIVAGSLWSIVAAPQSATPQAELELKSDDPKLQEYWEPLAATLSQDLLNT